MPDPHANRNIFCPDVAPSSRGGAILYQDSQRVHISLDDIPEVVAAPQAIERRQLIDECRRIAGVAA